jgi:hypothetical protein
MTTATISRWNFMYQQGVSCCGRTESPLGSVSLLPGAQCNSQSVFVFRNATRLIPLKPTSISNYVMYDAAIYRRSSAPCVAKTMRPCFVTLRFHTDIDFAVLCFTNFASGMWELRRDAVERREVGWTGKDTKRSGRGLIKVLCTWRDWEKPRKP